MSNRVNEPHRMFEFVPLLSYCTQSILDLTVDSENSYGNHAVPSHLFRPRATCSCKMICGRQFVLHSNLLYLSSKGVSTLLRGI